MALTPRLAPVDRWTLAYAVVASAALVWHWRDPLPHPGLLAAAHLALLGLPFLASRGRRSGAVGGFLAEWYPLLVAPALYSAVGILNFAAGRSFDPLVQGWEQALFGGHPSREWIRAQPWPWLSWVLHAGYLSYYLIVAGAPLGLWLKGRREEARRTILLMSATFYVCYVVFFFFPVAGPRYAFPPPDNDASTTAVAVLARRLLDSAAAWGTAFPSSHVAVSLVASLQAWRAWRPLGVVLVPLAILLALGTVYGQFHYAVDSLAGAALAWVVLLGGRRRSG